MSSGILPQMDSSRQKTRDTNQIKNEGFPNHSPVLGVFPITLCTQGNTSKDVAPKQIQTIIEKGQEQHHDTSSNKWNLGLHALLSVPKKTAETDRTSITQSQQTYSK
jgi:hypothetical protein